MTQAEFAEAIAPMVAAVGRRMTSEQLMAWHVLLDDLSFEVLQRAVVESVREHQFAGFPPIGMIRKNAGALSLSSQSRSAVAWAAVKQAVQTVGGYRSIAFDDPVTTATIRAMGGWERICGCEAGEPFDVWLRRDFEGMYAALSANGVGIDQTQSLAGLIEIDQSRMGFDSEPPVVVATGLNGIEAGKRLGGLARTPIPEPVRSLANSFGLPSEKEEIPTPAREPIDTVAARDIARTGLLNWESDRTANASA